MVGVRARRERGYGLKTISTGELDRILDDGAEISEYCDLEHIKVIPAQPGLRAFRQVTLRIPMWLERKLSEEAKYRGVPRSSIVNTALVEWIENVERDRAELNRDDPQRA